MSREGTIWPTETPRESSTSTTTATTLRLAGHRRLRGAAFAALGSGLRLPLLAGQQHRAHGGKRRRAGRNHEPLRPNPRPLFLSDHRSTRIVTYPAPGRRPWHLSISFGGGWAMDSEFDEALDNLDAFALGSVYILIALERRLTRRWSLALEAAWRQNDLEVVDFGDPLGEFGASGRGQRHQPQPERDLSVPAGAGHSALSRCRARPGQVDARSNAPWVRNIWTTRMTRPRCS